MQNNQRAQRPKFLSRILDDNNEYDFRGSTHVYILREELHVGLLPYGGRSVSYPNFDVEISGNDLDEAKSILNGLKNYPETHVTQLVCDVVNTLGNQLSYSGIIRHEIIESEHYSLSHIPEQSLYDLKYFFVQVVPKEQREASSKSFIFKKAKYVWTLTLPEKVCHWKTYRKILKGLAENTNMLPPHVELAGLAQSSIDFNFENYNKETSKYIYKILNGIGGNQRESRPELVTEFYLVHRMLRLNLSKTLIREHIIDELNLLFSRLNLDAKIIISELPTSKCVRKLISDIELDKKGLNEALSIINIY
ncbi:hypothetical protein [Pseudoalteromonas translucida]|mgnify:CR=1 FL=1|uniref:Uncharacterized protein n=1 Tax=Pseudoalteromonas translucida (strain TAC 125) TaxID=326442 RepID=Q3IIV6_PSET1|nr:hypothetical protein [Pseudoalteromonas translucida]CAI87060.1 conserved protein of unknown function; some similarity with a Photorhabdus luminescens putative membrane protein of unknown function [Pseudoalteromonas translucida]